MKKYSVARARQRFAEVLDSAESGEEVVIERRGISFTVRPIVVARSRKRAPRIELVDPQVEAGAWSWSWSEAGGVVMTTVPTDRTP